MRMICSLLLLLAAAAAEEPVRFFEGMRTLRAGEYLDLDTTGRFDAEKPYPGGACEMKGGEFLVEAEEDAAFGEARNLGTQPWHRLKTSGGRDAWVQVLARADVTVLRFVVRWLPGSTVMPAVRDATAVGDGRVITLRWKASRVFARYRVERGSFFTGAFETVATVKEGLFRDEKVEAGERYGYRIVGLTAEGKSGFVSTVEATTESRGVRTGTIELRRGDGVDFLRGVASRDTVDLKFVQTYGGRSGASFTDAYGRFVTRAAPGAATAWSLQGERMIEPGGTFIVPLKGGGVARCRLTLPDTRRGPEGILHYEAVGDAASLATPITLTAVRTEKGVELAVRVEAPYRIVKLDVRDVRGGQDARELEIADGKALDAAAADGQVLEYTAHAADALGRRTVPARHRISLLGRDPIPGEFKFHYKQGYSFELGKIVNEEEADVFFDSCAGGISSIRFTAARGIRNLERVFKRGELGDAAASVYYERLVGADPEVKLDRRARGDRRTGTSDVFVLRTRSGGWVKMMITHRGNKGGWTKYLATVRFVYNPSEPVFAEAGGQAREVVEGIAFENLEPLREVAAIVARWRTEFGRMWQDPILRAAAAPKAEEPVGGGVLPKPEAAQEVLLSRARHGDYQKATFSFRFGLRDDDGRVRNDWDLLFDNGRRGLIVNTVGDDRSTITDLGDATWEELAARPRITETGPAWAPVRLKRAYLVHSRDGDTDYYSLLRITGFKPGDRIAFEWITKQGGEMKHSPRFPAVLVPKFKALLEGVERLVEEGPTGATRKRLANRQFSVGIENQKLGDVLRDLGRILDVKFVVDPKTAEKNVVLLGHFTAHTMLQSFARREGITWRVHKDGTIHVR